MTSRFLCEVLKKDLESLRREVRAYPNEESLWHNPPGVPNSTGTLVLHVTGNLRHFIGAQLGATGYARNRDAEFNERDVPARELELRIDEAIKDVEVALAGLEEGRLEEEYPLEVDGAKLATGLFLMRLLSHLAYHVGQVNYHRRVVQAEAEAHRRQGDRGSY